MVPAPLASQKHKVVLKRSQQLMVYSAYKDKGRTKLLLRIYQQPSIEITHINAQVYYRPSPVYDSAIIERKEAVKGTRTSNWSFSFFFFFLQLLGRTYDGRTFGLYLFLISTSIFNIPKFHVSQRFLLRSNLDNFDADITYTSLHHLTAPVLHQKTATLP